MDGVIGLAESLKIFVFLGGLLAACFVTRVEFAHIKHRFGYDVLLGGPVAEVAVPAAFAAKWKLRVSLRIGRRLANRAAMFHRNQPLTARDSPLAKSRSR